MMPPRYLVTFEAGQAWRNLGLWRKLLIRVVAPDLAVAASQEARQAIALGVPEPSPRITGRATDVFNDWGGRR